ncbi:MAG: glycoside hydrolase family 28 protein [Marinilabilia sp.]
MAISTPLFFISAEAQSEGYFSDVPHEISSVDAPFETQAFSRPRFPDQTFDIRDFGAEKMGGEKKKKCTDAIHEAIDAAADAGGGIVLIPAGQWLTGPVHLKSNINLHLEEDASLFFSEDKEDYLPVVPQRYEGVEVYNYSPLIYANKVENVAITGKGTLEGQGEHWLDWGTVQPRAQAAKEPLSRRKNFGKGAGKEGMRPNFVVFWKSNNILVEGITLNETPMWNIHLVYSENAIVRDVTVNSLESHNGDGIVLDSSRGVLLEYNHLSTGDDAIVLKSGFNEDGLAIDTPTENVVIRNYYAYKVRTGSGGVVFGSETSGGIRNVYVHDAVFEKCDRGIRFKTTRGRGNVVENIFIRDVKMKDINNEAINFNTSYAGAGVGPSPLVRNIDIRDIQIDEVPNAIVMKGLPEKWIESIQLKDVVVTNARKGVRLARVKNVTLKNLRVESEKKAFKGEDVYELYLKNIKLSDREKGAPVLLKGKYTGVVVSPEFSKDDIELGKGVDGNVIVDDLPESEW